MAASPPERREGPSTAAHDFHDARFKIIEAKRDIKSRELSTKHLKMALTLVLIGDATVVLTLTALRIPQYSPLRLPTIVLAAIDSVTVLTGVIVLIVGWRSVASRTKTIGELGVRIAKLRESERDARARMPVGSVASLLWSYHSDVLNDIDEYRQGARGYRRVHNRFQTVIIIGSLMTTAISTAAIKYGYLEWGAIAVSFAVGVSAGMTGYFKFRERSMNLQQAADTLEFEYRGVELGIRHYRRLPSEEDRLVEFAERAEHIKDEQRKREQQLEQPPEVRVAASTTSQA